jgi:hypothetical protein
MVRCTAVLWFLCLPASGQAVDAVTLAFLADILRATPPALVSAFVCWKSGKMAARVLPE